MTTTDTVKSTLNSNTISDSISKVDDFDDWDAFSSNRRNFAGAKWTAEELRKIDAETGLAQKFGYTEQEFARIKAWATMQFLEEWVYIGEHEDEGEVFLDFEEEYVSISCPWMESTGRWELTDEGALNWYGEKFLKEWCDLAHKNLQQEGRLDYLKNWAKGITYVEGYPFKNPAEQFGLE